MLNLTENASTILHDVAALPPEAGKPVTTGVRISTDDADQPALTLATAAGAEPGDEVVEQGGATIYLDAGAAGMLEDKILDAAVDDQGHIEFALGTQV